MCLLMIRAGNGAVLNILWVLLQVVACLPATVSLGVAYSLLAYDVAKEKLGMTKALRMDALRASCRQQTDPFT